MSLIILYGIKDDVKDVTEICLQKLTYNNIITIPNGDHHRAKYFIDHLIGIEKKIFIIINNEEFEYNQLYIIKINLENFTITTENGIDNIDNIENNIKNINNKLQIKYDIYKKYYQNKNGYIKM